MVVKELTEKGVGDRLKWKETWLDGQDAKVAERINEDVDEIPDFSREYP